MGRHYDAPVGQRGRGVRELQQRECVVALADADRRCVAHHPRLLHARLLPLPAGQNARLLAHEVDACLLAEAPGHHEVMDRVDAQAGGEPVVVDVRRDGDRLAKVEPALGHAAHVAEPVLAEREDARVVKDEVRSRRSRLQACERNERLVRGADRIEAAHGAVEKWLRLGRVELGPGLRIDAAWEEIRIVGRHGDEGEDLTRLGLDGDDGAHLSLHGVFSDALKVHVDRQVQVLACLGRLEGERAHGMAACGDLQGLVSRSAVKEALVAALDADLADDALTLVVVDEALAGQALLVGLGQGADVAEDVAADAPFGIDAVFALVDLDAGKAPLLAREDGDLLVGELLTDGDRVIAVEVFAQAHEAAAVRRRDGNDLRERVDGLLEVGHLVWRDFQRVGERVLREQLAVAVVDEAAGGLRDNRDRAVLFRTLRVGVLVDDLQPREASDQNAEEHDHQKEDEEQTPSEGNQIRVHLLEVKRHLADSPLNGLATERAPLRKGEDEGGGRPQKGAREALEEPREAGPEAVEPQADHQDDELGHEQQRQDVQRLARQSEPGQPAV